MRRLIPLSHVYTRYLVKLQSRATDNYIYTILATNITKILLE